MVNPKVGVSVSGSCWVWRYIDDIPEHAFAPMRGYIEAYRTGKNYFTFPAESLS